MAFEPTHRPGVPGRPGDPIQRALDTDGVPEEWLLEPEYLELAEQVDRLAGDVELVTLLALGGYEGRDWDYFATELAKYGLAVLGGWMRRGLIFQSLWRIRRAA